MPEQRDCPDRVEAGLDWPEGYPRTEPSDRESYPGDLEPPSGVETERYCWPWFDEDELAEIAATGEVPQALLEVDDG